MTKQQREQLSENIDLGLLMMFAAVGIALAIKYFFF